MEIMYKFAKNFICAFGFIITVFGGIFLLVKFLDYITKLIPIENHTAVFFVLLFVLVSAAAAIFKTISDTK